MKNLALDSISDWLVCFATLSLFSVIDDCLIIRWMKMQGIRMIDTHAVSGYVSSRVN